MWRNLRPFIGCNCEHLLPRLALRRLILKFTANNFHISSRKQRSLLTELLATVQQIKLLEHYVIVLSIRNKIIYISSKYLVFLESQLWLVKFISK